MPIGIEVPFVKGDVVRVTKETTSNVGGNVIQVGRQSKVMSLLIDDDVAPNQWYASVVLDGMSWAVALPCSLLEKV